MTPDEWHAKHEPQRNVDPDTFERRTVALELSIASYGEATAKAEATELTECADYFLTWLEGRS